MRRSASGSVLIATALVVMAVAVVSGALMLARPADPLPVASPTVAAEPRAPETPDALATPDAPDGVQSGEVTRPVPPGGDGTQGPPASLEGDGAAGDGAAGDGDAVAETARERLVIMHTGDVSLDTSYVPALRELGLGAVWTEVGDTLAGADLAMVNLECPVGPGGTAQAKQFVFRCDPAALPAMRAAGVDVVTLANNHSGDYGMEVMLASIGIVEQAGMASVGVGTDEASAHAPALFEIGGWRIAVVGFGGVVPVADWIAYGGSPGQATGYDAARMAATVAAASELADLVVVSVHWGNEGALEPRPEDRVKAQAMIDAGADLIVGHHAHRLQPVERIGDASVFWNMGNFVWPRFSADGARTAIAQWTIEPDGTTQACLLPAEIDARGVPALTGAPPDCA